MEVRQRIKQMRQQIKPESKPLPQMIENPFVRKPK
jgi:hypothetical protein